MTSPLEVMGGVRGRGEGQGGAREGEGGRGAVREGCRRREDVVEEGDMAAVMSNARHTDRGFFVVPKVVDVGE